MWDTGSGMQEDEGWKERDGLARMVPSARAERTVAMIHQNTMVDTRTMVFWLSQYHVPW